MYKIPSFVVAEEISVQVESNTNGKVVYASVSKDGKITYPPISLFSMTLDEACDHMHALRELIAIAMAQRPDFHDERDDKSADASGK